MSVDHSSGDHSGDRSSVEDRLVALERASDERRAELRRLAADVPAAVSRRSLLVGAVRDLKTAPNKGDIVRRAARKIVRLPASLLRRLTAER
jgi:hypothetical protein